MLRLKKITSVNGFDESSLDNARQNNYAWSMQELEDYIYVGTGRNIALSSFASIPGINPALDFVPNKLDMTAEIWRYKKDGTEKWERVFKTNVLDGVVGFRFMYKFESFGLKPTLYACSYGRNVKIYKSTNGVNWFLVPDTTLKGSSSRVMASNNGKIYLATVEDAFGPGMFIPYIYSSTDPELYGWKLETPISTNLDPTTNIQGAVQFMIFFNNHLYAATLGKEGISIWRTLGEEPKVNGWKLVLDKGGGDATNVFPASMGIFGNYLYLGTGVNPSDFERFKNPKGADIFRIDKNDVWELVVGSTPVEPTDPTTGKRGLPISGYGSGFNRKYNFYIWQIREYLGQLLVTTYDYSSSVEPNLENFIKNRDLFANLPGYSYEKIDEIIDSLTKQVEELKTTKYPMGFDLYESYGRSFQPITLQGFGNPHNYGGRILFEGSNGMLYIGTANPFEGCEVWENYGPFLGVVRGMIDNF